MASLNKIFLIGSICSDIDVKATENDSVRAKFSLSVQRPSRDNLLASFDIIPIIAWGPVAQIVQDQFSKDAWVSIEGRILVSSFETQDGIRKWVTEVDCREIKSALPVGSSDSGSFVMTDHLTASSNADSVTDTPFVSSVSEDQLSTPKYGLEEDVSEKITESDFDFSDSSETEFKEVVGEDVPF